MNKKMLAIVLLVVGGTVLGFWAMKGTSCGDKGASICLWTSLQTEVITEEDDGFGGEKHKLSTWKDEFKPGLLDFTLPIGGLCSAGAIALLVLEARARKRQGAPA
ncbi:MAG: hypothetical protein EXR79_05635 [Myxococcales bacterium]|nr:hypothetical protein [Myxococcales bacterium]